MRRAEGAMCLEGQYNAPWYRSDHLALMLEILRFILCRLGATDTEICTQI